VITQFAAVVIAFISTGSHLKTLANARASEAIRRLVGMQAGTTRVREDGGEAEPPIDAVRQAAPAAPPPAG
jgi:cation transport ATPase